MKSQVNFQSNRSFVSSMLLKHLDNNLALQNLLERCGRSNEFGNVVSEKDFVFFATVITSQAEIAGYAPEFWFD
jgi:hypothetical protein